MPRDSFGGKARAGRAREKKTQGQLAAHRRGRRAKRKPIDARFACSVVALCLFIALMLFAYYQLVQLVQHERAQVEAEVEVEVEAEVEA